MSSSRKSATVCNNSGNAMSPLARPGVRSSVAIVDMCLIGFMGSSNLALNLTPCMNSSQPERGLLKSANIEECLSASRKFADIQHQAQSLFYRRLLLLRNVQVRTKSFLDLHKPGHCRDQTVLFDDRVLAHLYIA